jgi:hypothetical protein
MMFSALKSILSNQVSPGAAFVYVSPFSFPWFTRITVDTSISPMTEELHRIRERLLAIQEVLEDDQLDIGRTQLNELIESLQKV